MPPIWQQLRKDNPVQYTKEQAGSKSVSVISKEMVMHLHCPSNQSICRRAENTFCALSFAGEEWRE